MDFATSTSPAVQRQLDRLTMLSPGRDVLGLERITALLARLGDPHHSLPPVFHVAGTNGKGSTCAFLRAAIEAAGLSAHVYTSPHLVRFNERIRIAGTLISDDVLAPLLEEVLEGAEDINPSFFEATTAAAFLAFSRTPADACVVEVGLGGRLDATNVIERPAVCGIAQLGIDHQAFLGDRAEDIAAEKAGIAKPGVPLVTMNYPPPVSERVRAVVRERGAKWLPNGDYWECWADEESFNYWDARGDFKTAPPRLAGAHQADNAGLAIAMLRFQQAINLPVTALQSAVPSARWPARLQPLQPGPLLSLLPQGASLWLDGGHNPAAAAIIANWAGLQRRGRPLHLILGMLANKDAAGFLDRLDARPFRIHAVPVPEHEHHAPDHLAAMARVRGYAAEAHADFQTALAAIGSANLDAEPAVLIAGTLYLAGRVLEANGEVPD